MGGTFLQGTIFLMTTKKVIGENLDNLGVLRCMTALYSFDCLLMKEFKRNSFIVLSWVNRKPEGERRNNIQRACSAKHVPANKNLSNLEHELALVIAKQKSTPVYVLTCQLAHREATGERGGGMVRISESAQVTLRTKPPEFRLGCDFNSKVGS